MGLTKTAANGTVTLTRQKPKRHYPNKVAQILCTIKMPESNLYNKDVYN